MDITTSDLDSCIQDWIDLTEEYKALEVTHRDYVAKLEELSNLQSKCIKELAHQKYRLSSMKQAIKRLKPETEEEKTQYKCLQQDLMTRQAQLSEMEEILPKKSGFYLKLILGSVNVSFLNKADKFKYKDEYEKFKLALSVIAMVLSVINLLSKNRVLDLAFMFLTVWYYCTLTIRESILRVNGSRIKGWWRAHHFITTVLGGVLLTWPDAATYHLFRTQLMWFYTYISFVQYLQFRYQQGCLYRLKALGERHNMDITIEGFHSWMWRGLSFLLPFLYLGYFFQLYNAWVLFQLWWHPQSEWQIPILAMLFFTLFVGNTVTTSVVIPQKLKEKVHLKNRFTRLNKYLWSLKKNGRKRTYTVTEIDAADDANIDSVREPSEDTLRQRKPQAAERNVVEVTGTVDLPVDSSSVN